MKHPAYLRHRIVPALVGIVLGLSCFIQVVRAQQAGTDQPNIIFIYLDDLGYGDVTCYNPDSKIHTPQIDRLAKEGMLFTDAHTPAAICGPSRYGLITGRYPWRRGKTAPVTARNSEIYSSKKAGPPGVLVAEQELQLCSNWQVGYPP